MSDQLAPCPQCASEYTYEAGQMLVCPMCAHEWQPDTDSKLSGSELADDGETVVKDAVGNVLVDGDTVSVLKGLKVKGGGGGVVKVGTKVRGIRLIVDAADGHDIDAKVPGFGQMNLKSSVVKKAI